ncbi:glycosyltransferase family 2 protein [Aquibium microcysteis]|uniref:glycosyltransferase family 2 protein n=1 Tax=Aquibium microcysteis TaxID=675281 RepID=UPI00165D03F5|nr:glycosyltransferase family 2 protein [Aquibium microcysteis]
MTASFQSDVMDSEPAANAAGVVSVGRSSVLPLWKAWPRRAVAAVRSAWRAVHRAVAAWIAEQRRTFESTSIKFSIVLSLAVFVGCAAYHFGTLGMVGADVFLHYAMLLALLYCSLAYQFNRFGAARRREDLQAVQPAQITWREPSTAPSVTILVPSYREERRVLIGTVLSAAIAEYANRRIAVLVDDAPSDASALRTTLSAIEEVTGWLGEQAGRRRDAYASWQSRKASTAFDAAAEARTLSVGYRDVAGWLSSIALRLEQESPEDFQHVDGFIAERIVRAAAAQYRDRAERLANTPLTAEEAEAEHLRLSLVVCDDVTHFQRKTFANLSHAPNKAMNLNTYIGLMGGRFVRVHRNGVTSLEPALGSEVDVVVPRPDYVLTLDADSVILHEYVATLVDILENQPDAGVAQTPYLTFPNGDAPVERIAGATTDIQYLVHQGSSWFDAAFWVGANALIRFSALEAISKSRVDDGKPVRIFIQDKTVIEDTGSTVDLMKLGWSVRNHFVPLAYSATPADFGALAIQRKRWANGGLIIMPDLMQQYLQSPDRVGRLPELVLRSHYLLSPAIGNVAVFMLMIWAGTESSGILWTPLVMLPYFMLYMMDLRRLGYRRRDLFGVCSLNLMLLPVNFAGIIASIMQMVTGRKGSFIRTPKISLRTNVPPYALIFNLGVFVLMLAYATKAVMSGELSGGAIPIMNIMLFSLNILLYSYGLVRFVGVLDSLGDMFPSLRRLVLAVSAVVGSVARFLSPVFAPFGSRYVSVPALTAAMIVLTPAQSGSRIATEVTSPQSRSPALVRSSPVPKMLIPMTYPPFASSPVADGPERRAAVPSAPREVVVSEPGVVWPYAGY